MTVKATPLALHLIGCGPQSAAAGTVRQLGFKAYNLARLARLGVPVPPAFVLGTDWFHEFQALDGQLPPGTRDLLQVGLGHIETASGLAFGGARRPLLVSARSGAPVSMPGMLETVLDVGLCDTTLSGFLRLSGNPRLVWDSYRRLIEGYAEIVAGLDSAPFAAARQEAVANALVSSIAELDFRALRALAQRELELCNVGAAQVFSQSPVEQLEGAIAAVFRSWDSPKAKFYRQAHGIDPALGTAVTVQRRRHLGRRRRLYPRPVDRSGRALSRLCAKRAGRGCRFRPDPALGSDRRRDTDGKNSQRARPTRRSPRAGVPRRTRVRVYR